MQRSHQTCCCSCDMRASAMVYGVMLELNEWIFPWLNVFPNFSLLKLSLPVPSVYTDWGRGVVDFRNLALKFPKPVGPIILFPPRKGGSRRSITRPRPYSGPPAAEILAKRREFLSPSMFHFYKKPVSSLILICPIASSTMNDCIFFNQKSCCESITSRLVQAPWNSCQWFRV